MTKIIGIGHKARRGKGAVGEWLIEHHGFVERNFATALYKECRELHGMTDKDATMLQDWGKFRRDHYDPDYWVQQVHVWAVAHSISRIVITDVRYPNEADWVKEWGGKLWNVTREEPLEEINRDPNHESEIALDDYEGWDSVISNEGTLEELYQKLETEYES